MEGGTEVDCQDRIPFLYRKLLDGRDMLDAGIVHQDIAATGFPDQRTALGRLRHVGGDVAHRHSVPGPKFCRKRMILGPVGEAVQNHVRPGRRQRLGHTQTDSRIGSRDDRAFARECHLNLYAARAALWHVGRGRESTSPDKKTPAQGRR